MLRYAAGASLGTTAQIEINSSCYPSQTVILQQYYLAYPYGTTPRGGVNCTGVLLNGGSYQLFRYKAVVTLPGTCSNFKFSYSSCCRPSYVSNLQNPTSYYVYFYSQLDNTNGSNSSPIFSENFVNYYSLGKPSHGKHFAFDMDNDSLYFELTNTLHDETTSIPYSTGHSTGNPIISRGGINYNHTDGSFNFTPTSIEHSQVSVRISEFSYNNQTNQYTLVGKTIRDLSYLILGIGDSSITEWEFYKDKQNFQPSLKPVCSDTVLEFTIWYQMSSLAADGSDFLVLDSLDNVIQIDSAHPVPYYMQGGKGIKLYLSKPLHYDDLYRIISQKGSDGNTLINDCNYYLKENDTAFFRVSDCGTKLELIESGSSTPNIYPSPAQDYITVSLPFNQKFSGETVSIYNLQGQVLYNSVIKGDSSPKIDLHEFSNGIYTLTIWGKQNQVSTSKFVISR